MPYHRITYNGFTFGYVRMNVTETPVYADDHLTLEGTNYQFEFSGTLCASGSAWTVAQFQTALEDMRCALAEPRGALSVQWSEDNSSWTTDWNFPAYGGNAGNGADMSWGPFPGELRIVKMIGGRSALYGWSIRCFRKDCFGGDCSLESTSNPILSMVRRWQHDIDGSGYTTRTCSGRLVVQASTTTPADSYRDICVPALPTNFKRERQSFTQSEDGRVLDFSVVDQEVKWTLPWPISEGNVNWTVRIEEMGMRVVFVLSGRLAAPPSIAKSTIFQQVLAIASVKFPINGPSPLFFDQREISEDVYGNSISFMIQAWTSAGQAQGSTNPSLPNLYTGLNSFGVAPVTNSGQAYPITSYGGDQNDNSGVIAPPPYVYDACGAGLASSGANTGGIQSYWPGGGLSGSPPNSGTPVQSSNSGVSQGHITAMFVAVHERVSFEVDNGLVVFPAKVKGQNPIVQQAHPPITTIIQAGYASRYAQSIQDVPQPNPPMIVPDGTTVRCQQFFVEPQTPQPVGDGLTNLYTVSWRYILKLVNGQEENGIARLGIAYPWDPRRTDQPSTTPLPLDSFPELIAVPH